jgi:hypothetical protein
MVMVAFSSITISLTFEPIPHHFVPFLAISGKGSGARYHIHKEDFNINGSVFSLNLFPESVDCG